MKSEAFMKTKQLKHLKTFVADPYLTPFGAYHKHRDSVLYLCRICHNCEHLTISKYKHKQTKDYFYRIHGKYWLTFVTSDNGLGKIMITGTLRNLLAQYWNAKNS